MKNISTVFFFFLSILLFSAVNLSANVYSSQLNITNPDGSEFDDNFTDGTAAKFSFVLNDTATVVTISVKDASDNSEVALINAGPLSRGTHTVDYDGSGTVDGKTYYFQIFTEQNNYSDTSWTMFFDSGGVDIYTRGGDIVTDMSSDLFGLIYAPNNGGPLGKGITIYYADASRHDPFLVARDLTSGGTIDWGTGDPMVEGVFDELGRFYVSSIQFGEVRRLNRDSSLTSVITGLSNPKGLFIEGTGADRVIYICDDTKILRAAIGNDDVFSGTPEVVGEFTNGYPRDVALDDDGFMYSNFRTDPLNLDSDGAGIYKYDISGTLPVADGDALWGIAAASTHKVSELEFDYGSDPSSSDDILYYATRAGGGSSDDGVWRIDDINSIFPTVVKIITEIELLGGDENINARSGLMLDAAGNLILLENANEQIFFISPPGTGATNSFTTKSQNFGVGVSTSIDDEVVPGDYYLSQNYPNPFNPSTTINFGLPAASTVDLRIYNLLGEEVAVLINSEFKSAGNYSIQFNASNLPSGVYVYTLAAGEIVFSKKMILTK